MSFLEEKVALINRIAHFHPASGVDRGWSWYVGGMRDTGDWYFRKLYEAPTEELQSFLNELEEAKRNYVPPIPDNSPILMYPNGIWMREKTKEALEEFNRNCTNRILFGKTTNT